MPIYGRNTGSVRTYADRASFDVSAGLSVSIWLRPNSLVSDAYVASRRVSEDFQLHADGEWTLKANGADKKVKATVSSDAGESVAESSTPLVLGQYSHVAFTFLAATSEIKLYVNGQLEASASVGPASMSPLALPICLAESQLGGAHFDGFIARFGVWSDALTSDDVAALFSGVPTHIVRPDIAVIADALEKRSVDVAGMVAPSDSGNVEDIPFRGIFPLHPQRLKPIPGPRRFTRRRAVAASPAFSGAGGSGAPGRKRARRLVQSTLGPAPKRKRVRYLAAPPRLVPIPTPAAPSVEAPRPVNDDEEAIILALSSGVLL